ncbi:Beta-xylosidase [Serratia quinivorans]|uniref:glycoside hydrolase family 5 protein n=1 Tax=Serratia quinivorans TaxID=137545 RepID=UPI002178B55D|nr:glycoside hydrolase family 5 protein [Serratia quinivorans]CAI1546139.1 Beta-xylosidase [Serratia quinivorans]
MSHSKCGAVFLVLLFMWSTYSSAFELGVGVHLRSYEGDGSKYLNLVGGTGFSSIREDFTWDQVERVPGEYAINGKMESVDEVINKSAKENVNILLVLDYGNKNITNRNYPTSDYEIKKFADYAHWTASRYKGKVKYYEIWNEWLVGAGVPKKFKRPDDSIYLKLVKETSMAIRKADPDAIIITGSLNPLVHRDRKWMLDLIKNGLLNYVDGISLHPYSYMLANKNLNIPKNAIMNISSFSGQIKTIAGKDIPLYITEMGYPTYFGRGGVSEVDAANWVIEYSILAKQTGYIKGVWWYDLINDGTNVDNKEHNFGFYKKDLQEKESAQQIKVLGSIIRNYSPSENNGKKQSTVKNNLLDNTNKDWNDYILSGDTGVVQVSCPSEGGTKKDLLCTIKK